MTVTNPTSGEYGHLEGAGVCSLCQARAADSLVASFYDPDSLRRLFILYMIVMIYIFGGVAVAADAFVCHIAPPLISSRMGRRFILGIKCSQYSRGCIDGFNRSHHSRNYSCYNRLRQRRTRHFGGGVEQDCIQLVTDGAWVVGPRDSARSH